VLDEVVVGRGGPSKMRTPPTCMWLADDSLVRNDASIELSLSRCCCATGVG